MGTGEYLCGLPRVLRLDLEVVVRSLRCLQVHELDKLAESLGVISVHARSENQKLAALALASLVDEVKRLDPVEQAIHDVVDQLIAMVASE